MHALLGKTPKKSEKKSDWTPPPPSDISLLFKFKMKSTFIPPQLRCGWWGGGGGGVAAAVKTEQIAAKMWHISVDHWLHTYLNTEFNDVAFCV
jgi:hypothetical protein